MNIKSPLYEIKKLNNTTILIISNCNDSSTLFIEEIKTALKDVNYKVIIFDDYLCNNSHNRFYKYTDNKLVNINLPNNSGLGSIIRDITYLHLKELKLKNLLII